MKKPELKIVIQNSVDDNGILELHFLSEIYDGWDWNTWTEVNMVQDVISKVNESKPSQIKLIINSAGGDASIGLAIYSFLKNYNASVESEIIGMAGSIATVIALSADKGKVKMARNAFFVIHEAWGGAIGTADEVREQAKVIELYTDQLVDIYAQRTGETKETVLAWFKGRDEWMNAEKAQSRGFCDEIIEANDDFSVAASIKGYEKIFANAPIAKQKKAGVNENDKNIIMEFKKEINNAFASIKAKLGIKADVEGEEPKTETPKEGEEKTEGEETPKEEPKKEGEEKPKEEGSEKKEENETVANVLNVMQEVLSGTFEKVDAHLSKSEKEIKALKKQLGEKIGGEMNNETTDNNEETPIGFFASQTKK